MKPIPISTFQRRHRTSTPVGRFMTTQPVRDLYDTVRRLDLEGPADPTDPTPSPTSPTAE
jgi:hypothetical protein